MLLHMELQQRHNYPSRDLGRIQLYTAVFCGTTCPRHFPNRLSREAYPSRDYFMLLPELF